MKAPLAMRDSLNRYSIRSIVILGSITGIVLIVFSLTSYYLLADNVRLGRSLASTINVSGRQRMLTERIALLALVVATTQDPQSRQTALTEINTAIKQIKVSNLYLYQQANQSQIKAIFTASPYAINLNLNKYTKNAAKFIRSPLKSQIIRDQHWKILLSSSRQLVGAFNALTQAFQKESEINTAAIIRKGIAVMLLEIFSIVLLALFVFKPLAWRIKDSLAI